MITVDLATWSTLIALLVGVITICGFIVSTYGKLDTKIDKLRDDVRADFATVDTKIDKLRDDMRANFTTINTKIDRLDQRVYDLATDRGKTLILPPH